jgi:DNA-binding HxlR family transcriptional regulator
MEESEINHRSGCPISCALELIGDKWSLLIIRDMLYFNKTTYNEFLTSPEGISTNILNARLIRLTINGFITFTGSEKRKKYALTASGILLKPVIEALATFGMNSFAESREYVHNQIEARKNSN